jgi:hypothetical protein
MLACARAVSLSLLVLLACTSESNDTTTDDATAAADTSAASPSSSTAEPTSGTVGSSGVADECPNRPTGAYNSCLNNGLTDNKLCGWTSDGGPTTVTCLSPQSGDFNVCGLRDCVDDCDCFAPPTTGTAIAGCRAVFGDGGKACVLYCLNGQVCPDGMQCSGGTCYWPD